MLTYGIISKGASLHQLTKSDEGSNQSQFLTDDGFMMWAVVMEYSTLETDHSFRLSVPTLKEGGSN